MERGHGHRRARRGRHHALVLGELSNTDISSGNYQKGAISTDQRAPQSASSNPPVLTEADVQSRLSALDSRLNDGTKLEAPAPSVGARQLADWAESATRQKFGNLPLGAGNSGIDGRMTAARGSPIESQLLTTPYKHLAGWTRASNRPTIRPTWASPLRGNFAQFLADFEQQRQLRLADLGHCSEEAPEPSSMADWAAIMSKKFPLTDEDPGTPGTQASAAAVAARNEKWRDFIRRRITLGVLEHELGHSMGLRHQFTSSLRRAQLPPAVLAAAHAKWHADQACTAAHHRRLHLHRSALVRPHHPSRARRLIWRWQQTSVMDYAGDLTQDTLGIGAYDRARCG